MMDLLPYQKQQAYSMLPVNTTDQQFIEIWLRSNKSVSTQQEYRRDTTLFLSYIDTPLKQLTLPELQDYVDELLLLGTKPTTVARRLKSMKSMLSFGQRTGYLVFNIGAMIAVPKSKETLAARILTEEEVLKMLALESDKRNHALLRFLYNTAARVSEACSLEWEDVSPSGVVTIFGKGGKTRYVPMSPETYKEMKQLQTARGPLFLSQKGGHLDPSQVFRIIQTAASRSGIDIEARHVSPHWLRHSHASHALRRGVSIAVIKEVLGHSSIDTTMGYVHIDPQESSSLKLAV
jgi:site-specific recombinase XerD